MGRIAARLQRWTLRRRLVVVVVALVAVVAAGMGAVSALALRSSLMDQVDSRLVAANERAATAPARFNPDFAGDGSGQTGSGNGSGQADDWRPSPGNSQPGQSTGTVNVYAPDGATDVRADYIDDSGTLRELTDSQVSALLAVPTDGRPHPVDLGGDLGAYRAISSTTTTGATAVTALPTSSITETVTRFVVVEVVIGVLAVLATVVVGLMLVRRELRPLDRVAATATRVSRLPLDRGEVVLAERVAERDTDPSTEVGQVGAALNELLGHVQEALTARHESESQVRHFVADASHELRTPLASIRGYAELVRRSPEVLPDGAVTALSRIESEASRMTALVEDMLLLARLDAGRPLESEPVDLAVLAIDAVGDAHVAGADHTWRLDLPELDEDDEGPLVVGDEHRLRQVFANLLANARVHTPAGTTVTVGVRNVGESVQVSVADDGPGIPDELRDRLFQRFTRGDSSRTRGTGSTGLGLAIVAAVVGAHRGTITAGSGPAGGTVFTLTLPAA
ncbi:HAMP domain-containing histidine kinase [Cellulomonas sp. JH27-2]|uniref:sensor histidine kinase n=1 Tax=Cellulomonas sp. JH27-2 TaxID=2774139 RepID=UPI0017808C6E|nr:HAMP domain-containing sensor histidine kinase [Cellulomonas sp. JH27-2]MBD8059332.1 HAMP domain-containing histidine kinase [Cellulomonas sp. JH27-2]